MPACRRSRRPRSSTTGRWLLRGSCAPALARIVPGTIERMAVLATHEWLPSGTDTGAAAPVAALVHGITGWWRTWWRVGPALADLGWRVIGIDQRGHGESPAIDGVATAESLAADLALTIEGIGARPLDLLVGHSLGAAVSMEVIAGRPELARRLVLED